MAEAHGKLTGSAGVCFVTRGREVFQEVDYLSFLGPGTQAFVKRVARIDDVARTPEYVTRTFAT